MGEDRSEAKRVRTRRKRKAHERGPRRHRLDRPRRLAAARPWLASSGAASHEPRRLVRRYRTWFRVDLLCAIVELRLLGHPIPEDYEQRVRCTQQELGRARRARRERLARERGPSLDELVGPYAEELRYWIGDPYLAL